MPTTTGVQTLVFRVPEVDGQSATFVMKKALARVETPSSVGTIEVLIEKSAGGSAFSATTLADISITATNYENSITSGLGNLTTGQLLRVNFTSIGSGAQTYSVQLTGTKV